MLLLVWYSLLFFFSCIFFFIILLFVHFLFSFPGNVYYNIHKRFRLFYCDAAIVTVRHFVCNLMAFVCQEIYKRITYLLTCLLTYITFRKKSSGALWNLITGMIERDNCNGVYRVWQDCLIRTCRNAGSQWKWTRTGHSGQTSLASQTQQCTNWSSHRHSPFSCLQRPQVTDRKLNNTVYQKTSTFLFY